MATRDNGRAAVNARRYPADPERKLIMETFFLILSLIFILNNELIVKMKIIRNSKLGKVRISVWIGNKQANTVVSRSTMA